MEFSEASLCKYVAFIIPTGTNFISNGWIELGCCWFCYQHWHALNSKVHFPWECTRLFTLTGESYSLSAKWMKTLCQKDNRNCILIKWSKLWCLIFFRIYIDMQNRNRIQLAFKKDTMWEEILHSTSWMFMELLVTEIFLFILWKCEIHIYLQPHPILSL